MSHITFNRRQFLKSSSGFLLAIPFMESLSPKAHANGLPNRFVSVRSIYGQVPEHFYPLQRPIQKIAENVFHRSIAKNQIISKIIGEDFKSISHKISILRGLDHHLGGHNQTTMLSPGNHSHDDSSGFIGHSVPHSLDEIMARSNIIYPQTPRQRLLKLEPSVNVKFGPKHSYSIWNGALTSYDRDIQAAFNRLFSNQTTSSAQSVNKKSKVVDLALGAYNKLKNSDKMSATDKQRLDQYIDNLNDLQRKVASASAVQCSSPDNKNIQSDDYNSVNDAAIDIIVLALSCGMTNVASYSAFDFGKIAGENGSSFHDISHWTYSSSERFADLGYGAEAKMDFKLKAESVYLRQYSWAAKKIAQLMTRMDAVNESNGSTLLDNSLVLWGNEQSGSSGHSQFSLPTVTAGTLNGKVKPGYWDYTKRPFIYYARRADIHSAVGTVPYANLLTSIAKLYGLPASSYEISGHAGFGQFESAKLQYSFQGDGQFSNLNFKAKDIYADYDSSESNKRKSIAGWVA